MSDTSVDTKDFYSYEEVAAQADYRKKVTLPVYDLTASLLHCGEKTVVAYTYAQSTNRIALASECSKFVINTDTAVYMVLDSDDPGTDLGDTTKRIYLLPDTPWERVFTDGVTNLDFRTLSSGVTAKVRIEAYE